MNKYLVFTCEHSGNKVPPQFRHLFKGEEGVLDTHRGYDIGALELAERLADNLKAPIFYADISRLVVELNRSKEAQDLFSQYTGELTDKEKNWLLETFYEPYRETVTKTIASRMSYADVVIHLSIHSFTPELNGQVRDADIGLLYDPERPLEKEFCHILADEIHRQDKALVVKDNYPYAGTDDGFTTVLRKEYPADRYVGIEIEMNQKYPRSDDKKRWQDIIEKLSLALEYTFHKFHE